MPMPLGRDTTTVIFACLHLSIEDARTCALAFRDALGA